jgi:hypothetical protein
MGTRKTMTVSYIEIAVNGLFTGIGAATGTYLANKYIIRHEKKFEKRVLNKVNKVIKRVGKNLRGKNGHKNQIKIN